MNKASVSKKIVAIVALVALVSILAVCLVACNQEDYMKRLEKAGYNPATIDANKLSTKAPIDWAVSGTKKGSGLLDVETVTVVKFKETDDAKEFEEDMKELFTVKRSSKIVIFGTEQGVKDAQ